MTSKRELFILILRIVPVLGIESDLQADSVAMGLVHAKCTTNKSSHIYLLIWRWEEVKAIGYTDEWYSSLVASQTYIAVCRELFLRQP